MDFLIVNVLVLLANLCILGLNLKLYTEYFKDKSIDQRKKSSNEYPDPPIL